MMYYPKMKDYLEIAMPIDDTPFLGKATAPAPIVAADFQSMLTNFIAEEYPQYKLRRKYYATTPDTLMTLIQRACDNVYLTHAYTYQHLYDTTVAVYNPIENYNMVEHEETKNDGMDKTTHALGGHTDKVTRDMGSHTDTVNYGQEQVSDKYGARSKTVNGTGDVAPFETQEYRHVNKDGETTNDAEATDIHIKNTHADSTDYGSHTDTDTSVYGDRTDVDTLEHGHDITRDLTRAGNIGTLTTQKMLEEERHLTAFNLVRIVANDIIHTLCICYEGVTA